MIESLAVENTFRDHSVGALNFGFPPPLERLGTRLIQGNLRITDTLGAGPLSVIGRCPYLGGCY